MKCPNCNSEIPSDSKFCPDCGKRIEVRSNANYSNNNNSSDAEIQRLKRLLAEKERKKTVGIINGHEWIDLGLSVKWATCNIGASHSTDYGNYYAWGETSQKTSYTYSNYFDYIEPQNFSVKIDFKIYRSGGKRRIANTSGHDTAYENWGGTWRLPTDSEFNELCKKCTWKWIEMNGRKGYSVTGPNGNSIFLPASGIRGPRGLYKDGEYVMYWTSNLYDSPYDDKSAHTLYAGIGFYNVAWRERCEGLCVRPVSD